MKNLIERIFSNIGKVTDEESVDNLYGRTYTLKRHFHGRNRSYPYLGAGVTLTGAAGAGDFGAYTEIIPVLANEVNTLTVTGGASAAGNVVININGTPFTKAVSIGNTGAVAAQLRSYTYVGAECGAWTVAGSGNDVTFTRAGIATAATFLDVDITGVTVSIVKTNTGAGVNQVFDIHVIQGGIANKKDTYIIEVCKGLAGYEQRIGNVRVSTESDNSASGMIPMMTELLPAGTRVSARVASLSGGADTIVVSLNYHVY
jgi:hypothetical protein